MKFKECPFCGSKEIEIYAGVSARPEEGWEYYTVACRKCKAHINGPTINPYKDEADAVKLAIDKWNERAYEERTEKASMG